MCIAASWLIAGSIGVCPPVEMEPCDDFAERARRAWAAGPDRAPGGAAAGGGDGDPSLVGQWEPPLEWPVIGIHAAMLPTGKVLHYAYPGGGDGSNARLFDPATGQFDNVTMSTDIFCSGLSHLGDGRVFVTGGNDYDCEFQGRNTTFAFDPGSQHWFPQDTMADGRWYPTNLTMGDGRVMITNGLAFDCDYNLTMEIYSPEDGSVDLVPEHNNQWMPLFSRMHLLSDGTVARVGPPGETLVFRMSQGWTFIDFNNVGWRGEGTSVLVPGETDKVMIIGGYVNEIPTGTCEIIDFNDKFPTWQPTGSMNNPRAHADALILPDKKVLVMGGGQNGLYGQPVNIPEMYDPETETWTELPPHVYGRMYHATTVLLPDARVLVAGQDNGPSMFWGEIYEPPYLFRGARPIIQSAPAQLVYGQPFSIATGQAGSIESVALVKLSAVTHSVNFDQRYVGLEFEDAGGVLDATAPSSPNIAPPGYYMLFILNDLGVPSVASMVKIGQPHPADVNQDGNVDVGDLSEVILNWGPCPPGPCAADVNGDGAVGVADLAAVILSWGETG